MNICYHCMSKIENPKMLRCPVCNKSLEMVESSDRYLKPGTILAGKYVVGYPLGAGGFGITYIGLDIYLQRKVAIKEFYPNYCHRATGHMTVSVSMGTEDMKFRKGKQQFLEEARNIKALSDIPGVVKVLNYFEANATGYMIMEYLEGMDVSQILKKSGDKRDYRWSRRVVLTVLHTLKSIHDRGVLHRDISPDNVFVTKNGVVKLIDFGAARNSHQLRENKDIVLKNGYAPLEQYTVASPQGPCTDLYGVAAMFYRMLTGVKPPFAYERAIKDTLAPPSAMGVNLPEQAECAIMMCLSLEPQYRLQTAAEFMEALDGGRFVPVYDPRWILPEEKDAGLWRKIPLSAKLVAAICSCAIVVTLVAGALMYQTRKEEAEEIHYVKEVGSKMPNLSGMTLLEAEEVVESLNFKNNYKLSLKAHKIKFNTDETQNMKIYDQSVATDTDLGDKDTMQQLTNEEICYDENGILTGTIYCDVYSSKQVSYEELSHKNAYEISKLIGIDIINSLYVAKDQSVAPVDKTYWQLDTISLKDGTAIREDEINDPARKDNLIAIDDLKEISYYTSTFYYWDKLPDFKASFGNIQKLQGKSFDIYQYSSETTFKKAGKNNIPDVMINDEYISFQKKQGDIISQNIPPGSKYNSSKNEVLKINVVGKQLGIKTPEGKNDGSSIRAYIINQTGIDPLKVSFADYSDKPADQKVTGVKVYDEEGKEITGEAFSLDSPVSIVLETSKEENKAQDKEEKGKKDSQERDKNDRSEGAVKKEEEGQDSEDEEAKGDQEKENHFKGQNESGEKEENPEKETPEEDKSKDEKSGNEKSGNDKSDKDKSDKDKPDDGMKDQQIHSVSYEQICQQDVLYLADQLNIDMEDSIFEKITEYDGDASYWEVMEIQMEDGTKISAEDIMEEDNASKMIDLGQIKTIKYYGAPFYYWKELPDFKKKYGDKDHLKEKSFRTYEYDRERNLVKQKKKSLPKEMLDDSFYCLTGTKGSIIGQSVEEGEEYNSDQQKDLKIYVLGEVLLKKDREEYTGSELSEILSETLKDCKNISIEITNPEYSDHKVEDIELVKMELPESEDQEDSEKDSEEQEEIYWMEEEIALTKDEEESDWEESEEATDEEDVDGEDEEEEAEPLIYFKDNVTIKITCSQE